METLEDRLESASLAYLTVRNDPNAPLRSVLMYLLGRQVRLAEEMIRSRATEGGAA